MPHLHSAFHRGLTEVDRFRVSENVTSSLPIANFPGSQARHQAEENAKRALSQSGQFGDQQYQSRGFEESQYGGGGQGGYGGQGGQGGYGQGGQGGYGQGGQGGFDGQGGFPGDQEMRGGRMEGQGYGGGR
jgi:hypothetical protein